MGNLAGVPHFCEVDQRANKTSVLADAMYPYYNRQLGIVLCFSKRDRGRVKADDYHESLAIALWVSLIPYFL